MLATHDTIKGFGLFMIEPSGACYEYYGCASGRGKQLARNEIEKKNFKDLTVQEGLHLIAKILLISGGNIGEKAGD